MTDKHVVMGVAWYKAEQWEKLHDISVDKDSLEDTWQEWRKSARKALSKFRLQGLHVHKVEIDIDELKTWCELEKRPVDGNARSAFASYKLQSLLDDHNCCNHH